MTKASSSIRVILMALLLGCLPLALLGAKNRPVPLYDLLLFASLVILSFVSFLGSRLQDRRFLVSAVYLALAGAYAGFAWPPNLLPLEAAIRVKLAATLLPLSMWILFRLPIPQQKLSNWMLLPLAWIVADRILKTGWQPAHVPLDFLASYSPALKDLPAAGIVLFGGFVITSSVARDSHQSRWYRIFLYAALIPFLFLPFAVASAPKLLRLYTSIALLSGGLVLAYGTFFLYWQRVYLDELTGVLNRRALNDRLAEMRPHYSIAMIDIDHFKKFNDLYGHEQGDTVLRFVAAHLSNPPHGTTYRYGGEEFCIVFKNINAAHAARILDELRTTLATRDFHIRSSNDERNRTSSKQRRLGIARSQKVRITVSAGVSDVQGDEERPEDVLKNADKALYEAKQKGRNKVIEMAA